MQYHQSVCRWCTCQALAVPGYISEWLHWPKPEKKSSVVRMTSRKKPRSSACVVSSLTATPSITSVLVGAVLADEVVDGVVRLDRLPGIAPEAFQHVVLHAPGGH